MFIEYLNDIQDAYKNLEEYNPRKNHDVLIAFDDMIADMISNKNLTQWTVAELFIREKKANYFSCFYNTIVA